jgi:stage II sporulation protein E
MFKMMASVLPASMPWIEWIAAGVAGMFLAQGVLLDELYPFGIAFAGGVCLRKPDLFKAVMVGVIAGTFIATPGEAALPYLVSLGSYYVILYRTSRGQKHPALAPVFMAVVHGLARGGYILWRGQSVYDWISVAFESIFVLILILTAVQCLRSLDEGTKGSPRAFAGFLLLGLGLLLGAQNWVLGGIGLQSVACRWLVLCAGILSGPGGGALAGVTLGMLPLLRGILPTGSIAFYALAGLLAGAFSGFRKTGVCVGLVLGNLLLSVYFSDQQMLTEALKETAVAVVLFYATPLAWLQKAYGTFFEKKDVSQSATPMNKLKKVAQIFENMEIMFSPNSLSDKTPLEELTWDDLNRQVCGQVCFGCSLLDVCWKKDREKTAYVLREACKAADGRKSAVVEKDLEAEFLRRCPRSREITISLTNAWEKLLLVYQYESRLIGGKSLMYRQLAVLGQLMEQIAQELDDGKRLQPELQEKLKGFLKKAGLPVSQVVVADYQDGFREIRLSQEICGDRKRCTQELLPRIADFFDMPFEITEKNCPAALTGHCGCMLRPRALLEIETGQAQCPKSGQGLSGDMMITLPLPRHNFGLVISDGMGSGAQAREESVLALNLLEKLLESDLSPEVAMQIVNTALILGVSREAFATLDLTLINRVTGEADFVKAGGAPSMIWEGRSFQLITAETPPAGILDQIDPKIFRRVLKPGNLLISMSDGTWEALERLDGPEGWLEDLMESLSGEPSQQIAEYLLYIAQRGGNAPAEDDLCVQVARVGWQAEQPRVNPVMKKPAGLRRKMKEAMQKIGIAHIG